MQNLFTFRDLTPMHFLMTNSRGPSFLCVPPFCPCGTCADSALFISQSGVFRGSAPVLCLSGPRRLLGLSQPGRPCPVAGFGQSISSSGRAISLDKGTDNICTYIDSWCQTRSPSGRHTPVCLCRAPPPPPPAVPATRAGDLSKEFLCTVLGDGNDMKRKPRRVARHTSGRNTVESPKPASRHIASLSPCESWVVDLSPSQHK